MTGSAKPLGLILIAIFVSACASAPMHQQKNTASQNLQWPEIPHPARIKYLYSVSGPEDLGIRPGFWTKAWRFVKGVQQSSNLIKPMGVHVDSQGRIYVADTHRKKIHVFDNEESKYYSFPKEPLDNFIMPIDVTTGNDGRVYVSDSSSKRVHVFSERGKKYLRAIGADFLERPTGLAMRRKGKELLVVDTLASRIVTFNTSDFSVQFKVGDDGVGEDDLHYPTSIAVADDGLIYITDSLNFRIQVLDKDFNFVGNFGKAGDGPGYFSRPKGVAVDSDGHVYVVDALFDNVQVFNRQGELLLAIGSSGHSAGEFWLPNEIFIDAADRIYVSDAYNARVQVFQYVSLGKQP